MLPTCWAVNRGLPDLPFLGWGSPAAVSQEVGPQAVSLTCSCLCALQAPQAAFLLSALRLLCLTLACRGTGSRTWRDCCMHLSTESCSPLACCSDLCGASHRDEDSSGGQTWHNCCTQLLMTGRRCMCRVRSRHVLTARSSADVSFAGCTSADCGASHSLLKVLFGSGESHQLQGPMTRATSLALAPSPLARPLTLALEGAVAPHLTTLATSQGWASPPSTIA